LNFELFIVSYHIYQTEGIILGRKDVGEADGLFSIYSRDFGRIDAVSQGVRYIKSKLRYNLNTFSLSRLGLVLSKDCWRIIDAEELNNWEDIREDANKLAAVSRIAGLINRLVRGEEADCLLWKEAKKIFVFLDELPEGEKWRIPAFELLAILRILSCLGYVEDGNKWRNCSLEEVPKLENRIRAVIDQALKESQL
jgi:DNA repair protein RecO (recombination protein O)